MTDTGSSSRWLDAERHLAAIDADWARLIDIVGPCLLEPKPAREPWEALARAVAYQQLHVRAGDAIVARLLAQFGGVFPTPAQLRATDVTVLRGCGFSARKADTLHGIADGALDGLIPAREVAGGMADDALVSRLIGLRGIGRWTVEMMLIHTLGRTDVLPADDFGVRDGYRRLKSLDGVPRPREMLAFGEACRPCRTAASWYLWRVPKPPAGTPRA
jgi:DNA-3-methyladenine glycosylase II